ncbi:ATP-binding protein [Paenibacillus lycopersici]|uniref:ATP-binding protein n=1 Tax=Paenibacillus lycopersici TaxID=2704462 RepID=A0A6C0FUF7_9BACL|nr:ATP-binding protein [Paenibacillus lycopersici]QHT59013.1 ATP-binding protein [Paenibacillus lycopersici]
MSTSVLNQQPGAVSQYPIPQHEQIEASVASALQVVDDIVLKNYISKLEALDVVPLDAHTLETNLTENVRFFKITEMVYEKDEYSTYKFASVFHALSSANCAIFILIDSDGAKTEFYMGIRSLDSARTTHSLKDTLKSAITGQFPGVKTEDYLDEEMRAVLGRMKTNTISAVSCVANDKDEQNRANHSFVQGLEKLALSMQGEKYTAIILANGTTQQQLSDIRKGYEQIYTQLSPFGTSQVSYAMNRSYNLSEAVTRGSSQGSSFSETQSSTRGTTETSSSGTSESVSVESGASKAVKGLAAAAGMIGAALAPVTGGASLAAGGVLAGSLGVLGMAIQSTKTTGSTSQTSTADSLSDTTGTSKGTTTSVNESSTATQGQQLGDSQNMTLTLQDKTIIGMLDRIDLQLARLQEFESLGMWECAAYFMSENPYAAEMAASTYKALMRGEHSGVELSAINSWGLRDGDKASRIREYVTNFMHPVFAYRNEAGNIQVTPCSLVSGNELALHMGLPRRSVSGFPVIEHADFGKDVVRYEGSKSANNINLGRLFNMGSVHDNRIGLDRNTLTMHTFITGSTGSGKSNTVYELLRQLDAVDVRFMVIEPAKGEYKHVFGHRHDVRVLGTNAQYSELLRINPFRFPKGIHVLEHVDRLIEIFNVCWPMYAAMPAVLKDAVLQAYEVCGWDLAESSNRFSGEWFPTFADLQHELVQVIESSAYSQELKSNYTGSLVTRVKSLTNGLNGQLFTADETPNEALFDDNVIIDLSRVGSLETKSFIMGLLIMRLNEHRMTHAEGMNLPLKHVTVLEEAHHILRRASIEQNPENPSVSGKSVELLANAIAEMRTYGEGFIIADQSPSAVDMSAIRNTNTKIIMRLPDEADRRLAGKSAALKDGQLDEISKLPRGVAVVYQNDWLEPVLCQIRKFDEADRRPYRYEPAGSARGTETARFKAAFIKLLLRGRVPEDTEPDLAYLGDAVDRTNLSTRMKMIIRRLLEEYRRTNRLELWKDERFGETADLVTGQLGSRAAVDALIRSEKRFSDLNASLRLFIDREIPGLSAEWQMSIAQCLMRSFPDRDDERLEIYSAWRKHTLESGEWLS